MRTGTILLLFVGLGVLLFAAQYFVEKDLTDAGKVAASVGSGVTLKGLIGI